MWIAIFLIGYLFGAVTAAGIIYLWLLVLVTADEIESDPMFQAPTDIP